MGASSSLITDHCLLPMRVALVHDCIVHVGGAERVLQSLHALFPDAPIYTLVYDKGVVRQMFPGADIRASFAQRLPWSARYFRAYFPLYPMAVESFDLNGFDVILSSSFAFAKGVLPPGSACHICYCHTPLRYLWSEYHSRSTAVRQGWKRLATDPLFSYLRLWDRLSADRVDHFIANSQTTASRIAKFYRRDAAIIHPPVQVAGVTPSRTSEDFFLVVSRLMPYKQVDLAVEAFNQLGLPLKIVGSGPQEAELRRASRSNIEFLGTASDSALAELYSRCRALVFPGIEDFGIVMVEAQAYGKPVIACAGGGASEIVLDGKTGVLFGDQTADSLIQTVRRFDDLTFDPERIQENALRFDESEFRRNIGAFVEEKFRESAARGPSPVWVEPGHSQVLKNTGLRSSMSGSSVHCEKSLHTNGSLSRESAETRPKPQPVQRVVKRGLDLVLALVAAIAALPFSCVLAIWIKLDSEGPVIFSADRVGEGGRIFRLYKFRSMVADAEARLQDLAHLNHGGLLMIKIPDDPRVTRAGRFLRKYSLDEIPQLLNVIRGDMSLVGPRPQAPNEVAQYTIEQRRRLSVPAGITGWWQVTARDDTRFEVWVAKDLEYIDRWSLWFDFRIMLKTIIVVLSGKDAAPPSYAGNCR